MLDDKNLTGYFERMLLAKPERVREVVEFRIVVEPGVAALAASRRSEGDVARLRNLVERQQTASPEDYAELDAKFHMALARATQNEVVWEMAAVLHDLTGESRVASLITKDRLEASLRDHLRILKAIEEGNPEACREAMREHLENVGRKAGDAVRAVR
ncbi:MAG: GntR family transcriptional regulator transcriptional repressor for pyruvate dehydrogenase [Desulfovibrionaceae bacterium]|nr:MAG: GntR family transcriptional regulator transcriptional repressor for pyruvate dehydrogenase [Desulfovibrionaceae bacterium]